jgi:hypothetical protein
MSLLKFGFSRNRTTNKWPHESDDSDCDSNNNGKDAKYDKKRIRDFQSHWRDVQPALVNAQWGLDNDVLYILSKLSRSSRQVQCFDEGNSKSAHLTDKGSRDYPRTWIDYWFENSVGTPHSSRHRLKNRENETDTEVDTLFISRKWIMHVLEFQNV